MEITEASPATAAQPAPAPGPEMTTTTPVSPQPAPAAPAAAPSVATVAGRGDVKRKRGRPRKYGPDGTPLRPLNATPISASAPDDAGVGQYTPAAAVGAVMKRGRGRPVGFISRATPISMAVTAAAPTPAVVVSAPAPHSHLAPLELLDESPRNTIQTGTTTMQPKRKNWFAALVEYKIVVCVIELPSGELVGSASGANFTPHIINVAAGEDVNMKVISFSQQGPRAICILSANGVIANVTLRQQDSLGGTVTYEGRFELLSLSGSFTPTDSGGTRSRYGGMSVSLAAADGRVIGGGVAGLLVAASPVQVVVGSFLPSYQLDQNANKKPVIEIKTVPPPAATVGFTISSGDMLDDAYSGSKQPRSMPAKGSSTTALFKVENWTAPAPDQARKMTPPPPTSEAKVPVPGG